MKCNQPVHHIKTDVLIIGGGFSGLWGALGAREHTDKVLIVDKGPLSWGGLGTASGGDFQCVQDTTVEAALDDVVYYYDGLCDQPLVKDILTKSYDLFQYYERLGVVFARDENGKLLAIPQRNLKHMKMLLIRPYGTGGPSMRDALVAEAQRLNVGRLGRIAVTDLLLDDNGSVAGAVGFHTQSGEGFVFEAPAVLLATGGGGWRPSYVTMSNSVGEGGMLAWRAGAELSHNEFMNIWIQPVLFAWEGQTGLLPLGARLVNKDGEDFMKKYYSPKLGANTDTTYNSRGMAFEARADRKPFFFDTTTMKPDDAKLMEPVRGWAKISYDRMRKKYGLKFFDGMSQWMPQVMWHSGGPVTNLEYETTIPDLYAACRCKGFDPGVYMGGWALCTTAVTGYTAGRNAARKAAMKQKKINETQAEEKIAEAMAPLGKAGLNQKDLVRETQKIVFPADVCLIKSAVSLNKALDNVAYAHEIDEKMAATSPHDLGKLHEARTMLLRADLFVRSSLMRTETRAGHYREDFPERNNEEWLCWLHVKKGENGNPVFNKVRVPVENYPIQPYRYYMDNFTFPKN